MTHDVGIRIERSVMTRAILSYTRHPIDSYVNAKLWGHRHGGVREAGRLAVDIRLKLTGKRAVSGRALVWGVAATISGRDNARAY